MSKRLDENIATPDYDGLIIGNEPVADVVNVTIAKENGIVKRGTVVTGTAGGKLAPLAAAVSATNATYIVADDVDTTEADAVVSAYRTGKFNKGRLIVADEYTLTAADIEALRKGGILVDTAIEA